ncbi:protein phosphatase 1L, putative [Entamoeba invadens IP1]|uniref:protein phosphatase 1L, putative n=1 Tax=Entamoeba invadens IP1 TaxID=370355 RepID=UPI0002C3E0EA|nr:protein phosphatase 1L, putative [Entamoeba invadens IP1]ELP90771.1 protein phosphatase 1L, putative [Entamoeba invadens IP1]|eukprot:XP_004257542.1 protein phosphatase 1L, putative [Entamoeba invadens IP1]
MSIQKKQVTLYITSQSPTSVSQFYDSFEFVGTGESKTSINPIEFRAQVVLHCVEGISRFYKIVSKYTTIQYDMSPLLKILNDQFALETLYTSSELKTDPLWSNILKLMKNFWYDQRVQRYNTPPYHFDLHQLTILMPQLSKYLSIEYAPTQKDVFNAPLLSITRTTQFEMENTEIYLSTWNPVLSNQPELTITQPSIIIVPVCLDWYCFVDEDNENYLRKMVTYFDGFTTHPLPCEGVYFVLYKTNFDTLLKTHPLAQYFPEFDATQISEVDFIKDLFKESKPFTTGEICVIVLSVFDEVQILKVPRSLFPVALSKSGINENITKGGNYEVFSYHFKESQKVKWVGGVASFQGKRPSNEDAELMTEKVKLENIKKAFGIYLICDGHGGDLCSKAAVKVISKNISSSIYMEKRMFAGMMKEVFEESDRELCGLDIMGSGCTAGVVVIFGRFLICGNVGDTEILVISEGKEYEVLSKNHKAKDPDERKRITELGVPVFGGRVYGSLAVSRSLGDKQYKGKGAVISTPFVTVYELTKKNKAFVICCDGVFETLKYEDVTQHVFEGMGGNKTPQNIAEDIGTDALAKGSNDNVSVVVTLLKWK